MKTVLTDENGVVTVVHQKLRNKASEMRNEEIGSLEKTRDQNMHHAHRNRRFTVMVLQTFELEFEQPGGSREVPFEGK
jgi:hypothetical protein